MNTDSRISLVRLFAVAVLATSVSLGAWAQADLANSIANAKTKADHEAIASAFDKQGEADKALADHHTKMAQAYTSAPWVKAGGAAMVKHCKSLAANYKSAASNNAAMAKMHRTLGAKSP